MIKLNLYLSYVNLMLAIYHALSGNTPLALLCAGAGLLTSFAYYIKINLNNKR